MGSRENSGVHDLPVFRAISLWRTCKRPCTFWLPNGAVISAVQRKIHPACPNRGVLNALPRACLQNSPHVPPVRNRKQPDVPRSGGGSGGIPPPADYAARRNLGPTSEFRRYNAVTTESRSLAPSRQGAIQLGDTDSSNFFQLAGSSAVAEMVGIAKRVKLDTGTARRYIAFGWLMDNLAQ